MTRKPIHILFLSAWLIATGGVWDFVQVVAWANMFSTRLQTMSVSEAAQQTFQPEAKCSLCLAVEDGKRAQDGSASLFGGEFSSRPLIVFQSVSGIFVNPPADGPAVRCELSKADPRREPPPLPPPRNGAA